MYQADVKNNVERKFYFGNSKTRFKERFRNHIRDFKNVRYRNNVKKKLFKKARKYQNNLF